MNRKCRYRSLMHTWICLLLFYAAVAGSALAAGDVDREALLSDESTHFEFCNETPFVVQAFFYVPDDYVSVFFLDRQSFLYEQIWERIRSGDVKENYVTYTKVVMPNDCVTDYEAFPGGVISRETSIDWNERSAYWAARTLPWPQSPTPMGYGKVEFEWGGDDVNICVLTQPFGNPLAFPTVDPVAECVPGYEPTFSAGYYVFFGDMYLSAGPLGMASMTVSPGGVASAAVRTNERFSQDEAEFLSVMLLVSSSNCIPPSRNLSDWDGTALLEAVSQCVDFLEDLAGRQRADEFDRFPEELGLSRSWYLADLKRHISSLQRNMEFGDSHPDINGICGTSEFLQCNWRSLNRSLFEMLNASVWWQLGPQLKRRRDAESASRIRSAQQRQIEARRRSAPNSASTTRESRNSGFSFSGVMNFIGAVANGVSAGIQARRIISGTNSSAGRQGGGNCTILYNHMQATRDRYNLAVRQGVDIEPTRQAMQVAEAGHQQCLAMQR